VLGPWRVGGNDYRHHQRLGKIAMTDEFNRTPPEPIPLPHDGQEKAKAAIILSPKICRMMLLFKFRDTLQKPLAERTIDEWRQMEDQFRQMWGECLACIDPNSHEWIREKLQDPNYLRDEFTTQLDWLATVVKPKPPEPVPAG
jgi:hypothetical protein